MARNHLRKPVVSFTDHYDGLDFEDDIICKDSNDNSIKKKRLVQNIIAYNTYKLEDFEKKLLLIFVSSKESTGKDVEALTITFERFGFDVEVHMKGYNELKMELNTLCETDFTDYGCVAVAVLTHGNDVYNSDNYLSEDTILNCLTTDTNPTLFTKPRILIIQACRGVIGSQDNMKGVRIIGDTTTTKQDGDVRQKYYIPTEQDFLILHSSFMGKPSYRKATTGSWFIQSLCSKINELGDSMDFENIIREVKKEVAIERVHVNFNKDTNESEIFKQMPVMTSTLIRRLYLKKYKNDSISSSSDRFRSDPSKSSRSKPSMQLQSSTTKSSDLISSLQSQFDQSSGFNSVIDYLSVYTELNNKKINDHQEVKYITPDCTNLIKPQLTQVSQEHRSEDETSNIMKREEQKRIYQELERAWAD